jgi:hypothetical protein
MKATIQSTQQIIKVNGMQARVWTGKSERGIPFELLIVRVAVSKAEDCSQFDEELKEQSPPHVSECFGLRLIL